MYKLTYNKQYEEQNWNWGLFKKRSFYYFDRDQFIKNPVEKNSIEITILEYV